MTLLYTSKTDACISCDINEPYVRLAGDYVAYISGINREDYFFAKSLLQFAKSRPEFWQNTSLSGLVDTNRPCQFWS
jgi:hypothetical protein